MRFFPLATTLSGICLMLWLNKEGKWACKSLLSTTKRNADLGPITRWLTTPAEIMEGAPGAMATEPNGAERSVQP